MPLEPIVLAATLALISVLILEADATGGWAAYNVQPVQRLEDLLPLLSRFDRLRVEADFPPMSCSASAAHLAARKT